MSSAISYVMRGLTGIVALAALLMAGCGGAPVDSASATTPSMSPARSEPVARATATAAVPAVQSRGEHRVTRTIDQDPDGDGIANRRVVITETHDDAGVLLERVREVDFEADGIIDARTMTRFDD